MSKPSVLICGGVGFIGRNLVKFLVENDLCSHIRVVDKALPQMSYLTADQEAAFQNPVVQFKQGDLSREANAQRLVKQDNGEPYTFVVNLAAETKYGQDDASYAKNTVGVALEVAKAVAQLGGTEKFVQLSHAGIYESKSSKSGEDAKVDPWTTAYSANYDAERAVIGTGVNPIILRPAIVYGVGDVGGLCPRLICARLYQHLDKTMKFLWSKDLQINTVHVSDVSRAVWHVLLNANPGSVFNLADKSSTSQGSLNELLEQIFNIKTGFQNAMVSKAASMAMKTAAGHINDEHMDPWGQLCQSAGINNTPLSPYLDVELLYNKHMSIDGSTIESIGFVYERPEVTVDLLMDQIDGYKSLNLFP